jgi:D-serine deaminase-like pyridoxal phosphate-dependent protein
VREALIDVNVGLPRCGCTRQDAGRIADLARSRGLQVRGVMGYEGHVVGLPDAGERAERCRVAMEILTAAHADVGGEIISAGGTGTYALNTWANEIQAGSYALMDTAYGRLGLPFAQAAFVLATVVSRSAGWAVGDAGLKAFGMDHGNPELTGGTVMFCSDEHVTFTPPRPVGDRAWLIPAHIDPTMACHERVYLFSGDEIVDVWPVDLRGW